MRNSILRLVLLSLFIGHFSASAQIRWSDTQRAQEGVLNIIYTEKEPFIYTENKKLVGIEVEILDAFIKWAKESKGINIRLNYKSYDNIQDIDDRIRIAVDNTMAIGGIPFSDLFQDRQLKYCTPYMKNILVLTTIGIIPTAYKEEDIQAILAGQYGTTIKNSIYEVYFKKFREKYELSYGDILFVKHPQDVIKAAAESERYYGYTDIISYWQYTQKNKDYVKIQQIANIEDSYYSFAFPMESDWSIALDEFMDSGFGFTATKEYYNILKKYLPYELYNKVAID